MEKTESTKLRYANRWLAYFDLLGFKKLVRDNYIERVLSIYEGILRGLETKAERHRKDGISYSWFSDTFVIFSKGDSEKDFAHIEQVSRLFFQGLILKYIPVRGALTVGSLYTQQKKNIFLGEALIDAYEWGEQQNWLGFLLTPGVYRHLENSSIPLKCRPFYRQVDIPGVISHSESENIYAFAFNNMRLDGGNPYLDAIAMMKAKVDEKHKDKYNNTEEFIRKHNILTRVPG